MHPTTASPAIRIAIADDHAIFRQGLATALGAFPSLELVGQAGNGEELLDVVQAKQPHLVLTDIQMPVMDGVQATALIGQQHPRTKVIALSMFEGEHWVLQMLQAGARGYLLKNTDPGELHSAIQVVVQNGSYFGPPTLSRLLSQTPLEIEKQKEKEKDSSAPMTDKELQIMRLICRQLSNNEIAEQTRSTLRSVESARERIQAKIGTRNMVGIALYAVKKGIVKLSEV